MWGKPEWPNWFWQFLCEELSSFNPKGFWWKVCKGKSTSCIGLISRKLCRFLCFSLALLHSVSYLFFFYRSSFLSLCIVFDSISSNIDEVFPINPSANVFVFGDFHVHHKDRVTYSGGADWSGKLCYNFSISNDLTQMVNFPTAIPDCDSHSPNLLNLFLSSYGSICSTMAFPPLANFDHVVVSGSIHFPSNSQQDARFHHIAYVADKRISTSLVST